MKTIKIKEEFRVPGTDYILEEGDLVSIKESVDRLEESREGNHVYRNIWSWLNSTFSVKRSNPSKGEIIISLTDDGGTREFKITVSQISGHVKESVEHLNEASSTQYVIDDIEFDGRKHLYQPAMKTKSPQELKRVMMKMKRMFPSAHKINWDRVDWEFVYFDRVVNRSLLARSLN